MICDGTPANLEGEPDMRFTVLKTGTIRTWRHLLAGETVTPERIEVPVPFFAIEHRGLLILFDCGQQMPEMPVAETADYIPVMTAEDALPRQLEQHGLSAEKVSHLILSHAHGDHCGGLAELGNITCLIQRQEIETPAGKKLISAFPEKKWQILDGEADLFHDGRLIAVPTPGHTPGHQSLLLTLDDGTRICLAADALYMDRALDDDLEMRFTSREAVEYFRRLRNEGVHIISGHDPASFERAVCFTQ